MLPMNRPSHCCKSEATPESALLDGQEPPLTIPPPADHHYHCRHCGHRFNREDVKTYQIPRYQLRPLCPRCKRPAAYGDNPPAAHPGLQISPQSPRTHCTICGYDHPAFTGNPEMYHAGLGTPGDF